MKFNNHKETKNKYIKFNLLENLYIRCNYVTDPTIDRLSTLFTDHGTSADWIIRHLSTPNSVGIIGEKTDISIQGNKVILKATFLSADDPEEPEIEIDRNELLKLALAWESLVARNAPEIYIYRKDEQLFVAETLPNGLD